MNDGDLMLGVRSPSTSTGGVKQFRYNSHIMWPSSAGVADEVAIYLCRDTSQAMIFSVWRGELGKALGLYLM